MMKGHPVGTHILIKPLKNESLSDTIITDNVSFDYKRGEVIALGSGIVEGQEKIVFDIEKGDTVYYTGKHGEIKINGEKYGLLKHGQISYAI